MRAEWEELGSPATELGGSTGRTLVEHPLLRAMRQAEGHEAKQREHLRRRHRGLDPSAVLGLSSSARLRAELNRGGEPPRVTLRDVPTSRWSGDRTKVLWLCCVR